MATLNRPTLAATLRSRPGLLRTLTAMLLAGSTLAFPAFAASPTPPASAPPRPSMAEGLYGQPMAKSSPAVSRTKMMNPGTAEWRKAPFFCLQTELSPATLFHSTTRHLAFFTHLNDVGLGGPTYAAYMAAGTPRVVRPGDATDPAVMGECWVLIWFAGAAGWTDWDSPWVVYLQKRPNRMTFDAEGLAFRFDGPAGYAALLPLYGYDKPPQKGKEFLAAHGLSAKNVRPWEWAGGLPADVLQRLRYWANVLREFPVYCEDSFSIDRSQDAVTIRQKFDFISIDDDWKTPHLKLAPLSPVLALASMDGKFPVAYSQPPADPQMATPYGPYMGVEGAEAFDATFYVLQYIHETEASDPPALEADPTVKAALDRLQATARSKFRRADAYDYDHGGLNNFCWAILGDAWYAKGLPYYDDATRATALASLRKYFHEDVLAPERFTEREFPKGSGRTHLILEGPGIGSWGVLGDAGKFSTNLLETLWAYAHFTGDWDLLRERWPLVKSLFCTPAETRWVTFGREAIAELGDEAAPCLALARMAYVVGDRDTYGYASYMFARELAVHWVKQRGTPYFRTRQPWHTMEFMPEEVYLTNLWGETAAWQIDGPAYPARTGERQYANRWVCFKNEDVARFYRDYLADDVRRELDLLTARWEPKRRTVNDSHIMPSLVQLRSLLLNEPPADLAKLAAPDRFGGPPSGVIASCLSVLRTSRPTRLERLIPAGPATPFVAGLERERVEPSTCLVQCVQSSARDEKTKADRPLWPRVNWWGWKTPTGRRWSFGQVEPDPAAVPLEVQTVPLNWNTAVVIYTLP